MQMCSIYIKLIWVGMNTLIYIMYDVFSPPYKVLDTISCWSLQLNLVNTNHGYTFEVTFALHMNFLL